MARALEWSLEVRWFDATGTCRCGKPAHGKLMGPRNESFGSACRSCAAKALDAAEKHRNAAFQRREA